jgi:MOSC domain-containing protein YiiM
MNASVLAVASSPRHSFTKPVQLFINLLAGHGVEGDAHAGPTVMHRYARAKDPTKPNLRQVHLVHQELLDELKANGFDVYPGAIGENITTKGIPLLDLPKGTILRIGSEAVVEVTGLRSPCKLLENFQKGLMYALLDKSPEGKVIRKSGVMGIVLKGGTVRAGDAIAVELPPEPHRPLEVV